MRAVVDPSATVNDELAGRHLQVAHWLRDVHKPGEVLLNVGCGFGPLESFVLKDGLDVNVISLEPSIGDLAVIRRRINSPRVRFCVGSAISLPVADESIDMYVASEVLEHIPRNTESAMFQELARVLKPGGRALITTPRWSAIGNATDPAWWLTGHRHYQKHVMIHMVQCAGLGEWTLEPRGRQFEILSMWDLYISKWLLRRPPIFLAKTNPRVSSEWAPDPARPGFTHWWLEIHKPIPVNAEDEKDR